MRLRGKELFKKNFIKSPIYTHKIYSIDYASMIRGIPADSSSGCTQNSPIIAKQKGIIIKINYEVQTEDQS